MQIVEAVAEKCDFFNLSRADLEAMLLERFHAPSYRAKQLFQWVYRRGITDIDLMTDINRSLREELRGSFYFPSAVIRDRQVSQDGTRKYLLEVERGDCVEAVMIKQPRRMTLCISSQVGCGMGCAFCRTATMGFRRNLSSSEIVRQVRAVAADAAHFGDMFQNIVFMGMGEPLHNFNGVAKAVNILTDQSGLMLSSRKITVSTSGLVPAIKKFGERGVEAHLAVSLNATTDEVRSRIMPVNRAFPLAELLGALKALPLKRRQRVTIEYVMLADVNDSDKDLERLPGLLRGLPIKVNLIPYNDNSGLGFKSSSRDKILRWQSRLNSKGICATIRWSKGADISAACGQLAVQREGADSIIATKTTKTTKEKLTSLWS